MRLSQNEIDMILKGLEAYLIDLNHFKLYLFGSRVDDNRKGGDIDLLLVAENINSAELRMTKHQILTGIKKYISEQKIDLIIYGESEIESDLFYKSVEDQLI